MIYFITRILKARFLALGLFLAALSLVAVPATSLESRPEEYDVKLAYLFNLARFTYWSGDTSAGEFQICLVGTNPFGNRWVQLAGRQIENRKVTVRQVDEDTWEGCRMLYVSASERQRLSRLLRVLAKSPREMLTVSDLPGFVDQGGMVQLFFDEENTIHFALNVDQARQVGLQFKAQLRQLARTPPRMGQ